MSFIIGIGALILTVYFFIKHIKKIIKILLIGGSLLFFLEAFSEDNNGNPKYNKKDKRNSAILASFVLIIGLGAFFTPEKPNLNNNNMAKEPDTTINQTEDKKYVDSIESKYSDEDKTDSENENINNDEENKSNEEHKESESENNENETVDNSSAGASAGGVTAGISQSNNNTEVKREAPIIKETETDDNFTYVGNKNSRKLHYTSCSSAKRIKESNRAYFKSRESAINNGYDPCKRCNP